MTTLAWDYDYENCYECGGELYWYIKDFDPEVRVIAVPTHDADVEFCLRFDMVDLGEFETLDEAKTSGYLLALLLLESPELVEPRKMQVGARGPLADIISVIDQRESPLFSLLKK